MPLFVGDFRGHVLEGPAHAHSGGFVVGLDCPAEVAEFDVEVFVQENVFGFDVAVGDVLSVEVVNGLERLPEDSTVNIFIISREYNLIRTGFNWNGPNLEFEIDGIEKFIIFSRIVFILNYILYILLEVTNALSGCSNRPNSGITLNLDPTSQSQLASKIFQKTPSLTLLSDPSHIRFWRILNC